MTSAAIHVANRLPDIGIQLWASALLKGVANLRGDTEEETHWFSEHDRFSKLVIDEHMRAISAPEHRLIEVRLRLYLCSVRSRTISASALKYLLSPILKAIV